MSKIQAVILAGGKGSRLRPYTTVLPKPLMPLGEFPIAEVIVRQLKSFGLANIVISTGHLAELIEAYFGNGKRWGVNIRYVREDRALGTAGALKLIKNLESDFLAINGDVLTDVDYGALLKFHKSKGGIATITVKERVVITDFGVIEVGKNSEMADYIEKPQLKSFMSIGAYILNKRCKAYIKEDECVGMPELMLRMKQSGEKVFCCPTQAMWLDLGRFDDFNAAQELFEKNKKKFINGF
ncbi:MAG: NTP transferase domain-containing protein [Candidatus Omnitrophica bacterium]|nr:NTP transferase domain-containing protein [Candidatus Omnitrophota bacterium]